MLSGQNEAFSRVLIDKALEFSGWNLLDSHQVRFELNTETGRADYLLGGQRGPLCVLEAKREDVDPYDAKEQARGYLPGVISSSSRAAAAAVCWCCRRAERC
jgi:predicted type IV restriction endonuclease